MAHRAKGRLSFADALVRQRAGVNTDLKRIAEVVKWYRFAHLLKGIYAAAEGRPSYPPLVMLKCLLLQQWYGLSDVELEEAVSDRLSFRKFAGLALDEEVPDHTTFCRFRQELVQHGVAEKVFVEMNRQLEKRGLILKKGTLIDATLVEADATARRTVDDDNDDDEAIETSDPDAGFARRRGQAFFGYKAHVGVDQGSGLIRSAGVTAANVHDTQMGDGLICGDEQQVFADKAYHSEARRKRLRALGIRDGIMRRGARSHPLGAADRARNARLARVRCAVERVFATLKRRYRWTRVRYRGLAKNAAHFFLLCTAINLRRAMVLTT
jgi:transposase, IS5 family